MINWDILASSTFVDEVYWWENSDTSPGIIWTEHIVDETISGTESIYAQDIDADGNMDIIGALDYCDDIIWWENVDGSGISWTRHIVTEGFDNVHSVFSEDIDGDGAMDILGVASNDGVAWWKLDPYPPMVTLELTVLEIQWPVDDHIIWGPITWHGTEPDNTDIAFQVRSFMDTLNMGPWSDTITVSETEDIFAAVNGIDHTDRIKNWDPRTNP